MTELNANIVSSEKSSFSSGELKTFLVNLLRTCNKLSLLYTKHATSLHIRNLKNISIPPDFNQLLVGDALFNLDSTLETEVNIYTCVQCSQILDDHFKFYKIKSTEYFRLSADFDKIDSADKATYYCSEVKPAYDKACESLKNIKDATLNILSDSYKHWNQDAIQAEAKNIIMASKKRLIEYFDFSLKSLLTINAGGAVAILAIILSRLFLDPV